MEIIDIVFLVILLIAVLIGLKKGLAGVFFGFFGFIIIGVALGFVVNLTAPFIVYSDKDTGVLSNIGETVYSPISELFPSDGAAADLFQSPIIIEDDTIRLGITVTIGDDLVENPTLEQILQANISFIPEQIMPYLTGFIKSFARDNQTLASALGEKLTIYIVGSAMWFIGAIVLTIIKNLIRRRVYKWLDNNKTASKLDRVGGMAFVTVLIICIIWGAGLFLKVQSDGGQDWAVSANSYVSDNSLLIKELNNSNLFIMIMDGGSETEDIPSPE